MADIVDLQGKPLLDPTETAIRRVKILTSMLEMVSSHPEGMKYDRLHEVYMCEFGLPEETVGPEVMDAAFILARSGLLLCNTYDSSVSTLIINAETELAPSPRINDFVSGRI